MGPRRPPSELSALRRRIVRAAAKPPERPAARSLSHQAGEQRSDDASPALPGRLFSQARGSEALAPKSPTVGCSRLTRRTAGVKRRERLCESDSAAGDGRRCADREASDGIAERACLGRSPFRDRRRGQLRNACIYLCPLAPGSKRVPGAADAAASVAVYHSPPLANAKPSRSLAARRHSRCGTSSCCLGRSCRGRRRSPRSAPP